jgi:hypothetical protein
MMKKLIVGAALVWLADPVAAQAPVPVAYLPADLPNLTNAKVIEVKDSTGAAVLCGRLIRQPADGDELEKEADLISCGASTKASGEAEIEVKQKNGALDQEVELSLLDLSPSATYSIHVDSKQVGTFQTDKAGRAEVELKTVPPPAAATTAAPPPAGLKK